MVLHPRRTGRRPRGPLGFLLFGPRTDAPIQPHSAAVQVNRDAPCVQFGAPLQREPSILLLISVGVTAGFTSILLVTPITPLSFFTADSASVF